MCTQFDLQSSFCNIKSNVQHTVHIVVWLWPIRGWLAKARLSPRKGSEPHEQTSVFTGTFYSYRARGSNPGPLEIVILQWPLHHQHTASHSYGRAEITLTKRVVPPVREMRNCAAKHNSRGLQIAKISPFLLANSPGIFCDLACEIERMYWQFCTQQYSHIFQAQNMAYILDISPRRLLPLFEQIKTQNRSAEALKFCEIGAFYIIVRMISMRHTDPSSRSFKVSFHFAAAVLCLFSTKVTLKHCWCHISSTTSTTFRIFLTRCLLVMAYRSLKRHFHS